MGKFVESDCRMLCFWISKTGRLKVEKEEIPCSMQRIKTFCLESKNYLKLISWKEMFLATVKYPLKNTVFVIHSVENS